MFQTKFIVKNETYFMSNTSFAESLGILR